MRTRRDFLFQLALAGAALPLAQLPAAAAASGRGSSRAAMNRGSTCIHVFSKPLQWLSYKETAELIAEAGYGGIDYSVRPGGHVLPERVEEDLPRAVDAARKAGLKVEMITSGIRDPDDPHTEPTLRTASRLGIKMYRIGGAQYDLGTGVWETLQRMKPALKGLAELNRQYGIHGAMQNHSGDWIGAALWDLYELVKEHDPRWIGCQYDIRHATVEGGRTWPLGIRLLQPWITSLDIKDFKWKQVNGKSALETVPVGEGFVDFDAYFVLIRELDVRGPMSVHFEYPPFVGRQQLTDRAGRRAQYLKLMKQDRQSLGNLMVKHGIS